MRRQRGLTLGEVMMSLAFLAVILGTALGILHWALEGSRLSQGKTTAAFLAQKQMEALLDQEHPVSAEGVFAAPHQGYRWTAKVSRHEDEPFLAVEVVVEGSRGVRYRLFTERCQDRRSLVYRQANQLVKSTEDLHSPEPVFANFDSNDFSIAPDGKTVAYVELVDGLPQIFSRSTDPPGAGTQLFLAPEGAREPRYSPDGTQLSFTTQKDGYSQVDVYQLANRTIAHRSANDHHDGSAAWMPDSRGLLFCRDGQKLILQNGGGAETVLDENEEGWNATPDPSPDGKSLVLMSSRDGNPEIYSLQISNRRWTRLTNDPGYDSQPHFSRDGKRILFARSPGEDQPSKLYSMNGDGSALTLLTPDEEGEDPTWAP